MDSSTINLLKLPVIFYLNSLLTSKHRNTSPSWKIFLQHTYKLSNTSMQKYYCRPLVKYTCFYSYNYGKKVNGDATVTVYPTIYSGVIQPIFETPIRKVIPINGSASVNFDIAKELRLDDEYERTVVIDVTIEEALTGRRQNNSIEVHIHKYDYKMELVKTADYYKPGLKYVAYVKVSNHDGSVIAKDRRSVTIRYGFSRVDEIYAEERHILDKNGVLALEMETPRNSTNETALRIEVCFLK